MSLTNRGCQLVSIKTKEVFVNEGNVRRDNGTIAYLVGGNYLSESQLKETFEGYRIHQFKEGDRVRIKTFQEFKRSHKGLVLGNQPPFRVKVPRSFSVEMNRFCGKTYTIVHSTPEWNLYELDGINSYGFSREMFAENDEIYSEI